MEEFIQWVSLWNDELAIREWQTSIKIGINFEMFTRVNYVLQWSSVMELLGAVHWNRGHVCDSEAAATWLTRLRLLSAWLRWEVLLKTSRSPTETWGQQLVNSYLQRAGVRTGISLWASAAAMLLLHCNQEMQMTARQQVRNGIQPIGQSQQVQCPQPGKLCGLQGTVSIVLNLCCSTHFIHLLSVLHISLLRKKTHCPYFILVQAHSVEDMW